MVSAPPLPTGSSQTSKFYAHPRGTHWYHSHSRVACVEEEPCVDESVCLSVNFNVLSVCVCVYLV